MVFSSTDLREIKSAITSTFNEKFLNEIAVKVAVLVEKQFEEQLKSHRQAIDTLREQTNILEAENRRLRMFVDHREQLERNHNVRIFGIELTNGEVLDKKIIDLFVNNLKVNIHNDAIKKCRGIANKNANDNPPAVLIQFNCDSVRRQVLKNRNKLRNMEIKIKEDLTKSRLNLFREAISRFAFKNTWVNNGIIFVKVNDIVHTIRSENDLEKVK
ncbi:unnamed protein product [Acanthoscelides obtectus]|uniref:Uncharacterized protein n=1 Tax=Acanthoscelides obtectus TaxID=200917 RepID=A0A9P0PGN0_ACAOB|nr:unnamed protein product [Acanthoscelides obtectus]CAK1648276.1 hypothetical protein AOBTE_LOCUS15637 [Acanthoscelides obtectus]